MPVFAGKADAREMLRPARLERALRAAARVDGKECVLTAVRPAWCRGAAGDCDDVCGRCGAG